MNVLHIGSGNLYGGVEKLIVTLARLRHLCPEVKQHFAICFPGRLEEELKQTDAPIYRLSEMRGRDPFAVLSNRRKLSKLQKSLNLDVIVYHSLWCYDLLSVGRSRGRSVRALWMHDAVQNVGGFELVARLQEPEVVLANSRYTGATVSLMYSKPNLRVLYYPIEFKPSLRDTDKRLALRRTLITQANDVVILQSSRMEGWKGHQLHLDALSRLKDLPGWVLWIAGGAQRPEEQEYETALRRQAELGGISSRIRFLGHRNDIDDLLAAADIHCQPNRGPEPFGIAFIEAMMAGLPIATCRLGAAKELIDDSSGLLCEPGDADGLAANLRALITNPDLRAKLGRSGPAKAKRFTDPASRLNELFAYLKECVELRSNGLAVVGGNA